MITRRPISAYGKTLNVQWKIGARQARYRFSGDFYMMLENFPGALCDSKGFVVFNEIKDLLQTNGVKVYEECRRIIVSRGISELPEYRKVPVELEVKVCS